MSQPVGVRSADHGVIAEVDMEGLKVAAFRAALELGVLELIPDEGADAAAVASAADCDARATGVLLDALAEMGLLERSGDLFRPTPLTTKYLVSSSPGYCAPIYLDWLRARDRLVDVVRTGQAAADHAADGSAEMWACYAASDLLDWPEVAPQHVERWRDAGVGTGARFLDVGCGSGLKTFSMAAADPSVRVVAFDRAPVVVVAARLAELMGVADQVELRAADVLTADFGRGPYDVVLLGNILHYLDRDEAIGLLQKCHSCLHQRGRAFVSTLIGRRGQPGPAAWPALEMLSVAPKGRVYDLEDYEELMQSAGFGNVVQYSDALLWAELAQDGRGRRHPCVRRKVRGDDA